MVDGDFCRHGCDAPVTQTDRSCTFERDTLTIKIHRPTRTPDDEKKWMQAQRKNETGE
jgi:hypothetical protein